MSLNERIPVLAHLIGAGGEVSERAMGPLRVSPSKDCLRRYAAYGLDPAFVDSLSELRERTTGPMDELYQRAERGWVNTMSYDKFIGRVRDAKIGVDTRDGVPEVLSTGWDHPSGHAISFVFNHEPDGYYFYACNTGDVKDPTAVSLSIKSMTSTRSCASSRQPIATQITPAPSMLTLQSPSVSGVSQKKTNFRVLSTSLHRKSETVPSHREKPRYSQ